MKTNNIHINTTTINKHNTCLSGCDMSIVS